MKVKVIKLDDRYQRSPEEQEMVGKVFEALKFKDEWAEEGYKDAYALGLENCVYFIPTQFCEVVEEGTINEPVNESKPDNEKKTRSTNRILLVEDGSVDVDHIENELGIPCIVYRQGAKLPTWLD